MTSRTCPSGLPLEVAYSCVFCSVSLHHPTAGCDCVTERREFTMGFICKDCAEALEVLLADTNVGRLHAHLVHKEGFKYMRGSDD